MEIIVFITCLALILSGLGFCFGFGWAAIIFDFFNAITGSSGSPYDYKDLQESSSRKPIYKVIGSTLIAVGVIIALFVLNNQAR